MRLERRAVDINFGVTRVDRRPQLVDRLPIDFDAAFGDQLFTLPAAAEASGRQGTLQADIAGIFVV